jgi:CheY-like chemotaxis protein
MEPVNLIYIVDDDKIYRYTTETYIQLLNLAQTIKTFGDGEEAMDSIRENLDKPDLLPDVILLDVNMPIMDGWDFIEEFMTLKDLKKKITIYMVSSSIDQRDKERADAITEITDYIIKPITEEQLVKLIQENRNNS